MYIGIFDLQQRLERTRRLLKEKIHLRKLIEDDIKELEEDLKQLEDMIK